MAEDNNLNTKTISKIESELFALINTILNLHSKYQEGSIADNFFLKAIRTAIKDLLKFNFYLNEKNIILSKLLKKMNFTQEYYGVIEIINEISSLEFSSESIKSQTENNVQFPNKMKSAVLELPRITLEITSSFITLMDALKLKGFKESELINKLFKDLKNNLKKFPGIDDLQIKIEKIHNRVLSNSFNLETSNRFSEIMVDEVYQVFKEFQIKLNLKA